MGFVKKTYYCAEKPKLRNQLDTLELEFAHREPRY